MSSKIQLKDYSKSATHKSAKLIGGVLMAVGAMCVVPVMAESASRFWHGYLIMYMFLLSIGLGALFFIALDYLVGAKWSVPIRRVTEILAGLIPVAAVLAIPILLGGMDHLYSHWVHAADYAHHEVKADEHKTPKDAVKDAHAKTEHKKEEHKEDSHGDASEHHAPDKIIMGKVPYLNKGAFVFRYFAFFAIWIAGWMYFRKNSLAQDNDPDQKYTKANTTLSAPFIFIFGLTLSMAAIDWIMSLEPHWFSTMFGLYYFSGCLVTASCCIAIYTIRLKEGGFLHPDMKSDTYYSIGLMMFAFNVFWAYISFSQFVLIWYANLPEETFWYIARADKGWMIFSIFLMIFHFVIPFFALLSRTIKTRPSRLMFMAKWLLLAQIFDLYWAIMPAARLDVNFSFLDLGFIALAAGIVITVFDRGAAKTQLVPLNDPRLQMGLDFRSH
ncbi:MAG: quinol:cytochrome C oxidoreductase [Candidatus Cloacimonetes bacterium]|nr:quinol:cytochrome C oxidoreductase [Candidatus Cloacimonadota bacterium]